MFKIVWLCPNLGYLAVYDQFCSHDCDYLLWNVNEKNAVFAEC